jgi:hypothetical protein
MAILVVSRSRGAVCTRDIAKLELEGFAVVDLARYCQINFGCGAGAIAVNFDVIADTVNHVIARLSIQTCAEYPSTEPTAIGD